MDKTDVVGITILVLAMLAIYRMILIAIMPPTYIAKPACVNLVKADFNKLPTLKN